MESPDNDFFGVFLVKTIFPRGTYEPVASREGPYQFF